MTTVSGGPTVSRLHKCGKIWGPSWGSPCLGNLLCKDILGCLLPLQGVNGGPERGGIVPQTTHLMEDRVVTFQLPAVLSESSTWSEMGSQVSMDVGAVHVVIVGGGFGGIAAASQLQVLNIPFVLVDMKDSFHHNVAALRASVESGFAKKTFISYSVTFKENFRQGLVVEIDLKNQTVLLEDGEALSFTYLILATGSTGLFPGKFNQVSSQQMAIQAYEDMVTQVQCAQSIVVIGGGSAGVEMAAEIKTEYPEKEVTLIHSRMALADKELLPCVRQEVKEILLRKGVQLLLSERVSNLEALPLNKHREHITVQTDKGTEVAANLVIACSGIKINSSAYSSAFGDQLASDGALRVNEYLQVEGYSHIYAIGDCADVREPKMAYHASLHASVAVANIVNSMKQRPLKAYKPDSQQSPSHFFALFPCKKGETEDFKNFERILCM
uniref:Ferroptosis suppressor protein 1 n=1 Tax=Tursiops truncatus TaxID=9739 RepID=A0A6J3Q511_TURTR|nr:apoptosis-inducing factor 2 isoform X4 [Tursiops truncatus]